MWFLSLVTLCVSTARCPVLSGSNLGIKCCGTGIAPGYRGKPEGSYTRLFLVSHIQWLWAGPSWPRSLRISNGLTCVLRCVKGLGRSALSKQVLGMGTCALGMSALLGDLFSPARIWVWSGMAQGPLQAEMETRRILSQAVPSPMLVDWQS